MAGQTVIHGQHLVDLSADRADDRVQQHATPHFVVSYNRGLGAAGQAAAQLIGEGLSRVLSNELYPGAEPQGFVSAPVWLNQGWPDFVNSTDPSDVNYPSIGCAVLFLNWLHTQLGHGWTAIIAAGGPALADVYRNLGEAGDGWMRFSGLISAPYPPGQQANLTTDNPFPLS